MYEQDENHLLKGSDEDSVSLYDVCLVPQKPLLELPPGYILLLQSLFFIIWYFNIGGKPSDFYPLLLKHTWDLCWTQTAWSLLLILVCAIRRNSLLAGVALCQFVLCLFFPSYSNDYWILRQKNIKQLQTEFTKGDHCTKEVSSGTYWGHSPTLSI